MTFSSLTEAIDWAAEHWAEQRPVPTRLHTRSTEGVGLFFAPAFAAALDGSDEAHVTMRGPMSCYHPTVPIGVSILNCPECFGTGVKDHASDRYLYPMGRALRKLHNCLNSTPRQPHPYLLIIELAAHGWNARQAAEGMGIGWDRAEALFLMALRMLNSRYSAGPVSTRTSAPTWIDKSDSQRAAETAA